MGFEPAATPEQGQAFLDKNIKDRTCTDVFFLILWLISSGLIIALVCGSSTQSPFKLESDRWGPLWVAAGASTGWGLLWVMLTRWCAKPLTYFGILFTIVTSAISCYNFAMLAIHAVETWDQAVYWLWCVLSAIIAISILIFFCTSRHKLEFTIAMLEVSSKALMSEPLVYALALLMVGLQIGLMCLILFGMESVIHWKGYEWLVIPLLFYTYWALWLMDGMMRAAIGGGMTVWYFMMGEAHKYECAPILTSFIRACTKSLGSICKGSFILALITMVIAMLNFLERQLAKAGKLACPLRCCVCCFRACCVCILSSAEWATEYAYVFIAAKGDNFAEAGTEVQRLIAEFGVTAIMGETITRWVSRLGQFLGVGISIMCMYGYEVNKSGAEWDSPTTVKIDGSIFTYGVILAYMIMSTLTVVADCGTDSILVCYAIDLEQSKESGVMYAPKALTEAVKSSESASAHEV